DAKTESAPSAAPCGRGSVPSCIDGFTGQARKFSEAFKLAEFKGSLSQNHRHGSLASLHGQRTRIEISRKWIMHTLAKDLRFALRQCRQRPGFAFAIISTLAITVGANIAVFSVVNTVLLRALPFQSPDRLVWLSSVRVDRPDGPFSLPEYIDYRNQTRM